MYGTDENQVAYHLFVFNINVELTSIGAQVTELFKYLLNMIVLCMFLNLRNVTHLSLRIIFFCIF